jgi:hypothetical protein
MTNQEKIAQGFFTSQTDSITGEVTQIVYTDAQVQESLNWVDPTPQPTVSELQAQLADIALQLQALQGAA